VEREMEVMYYGVWTVRLAYSIVVHMTGRRRRFFLLSLTGRTL